MSVELDSVLHLAVTLEALTEPGFWISVGVIAGIYAIVALGLQLNVGFTGIVNFGQAAFMAIGAYAMAILVLKVGLNFWLSLPIAVLITIGFGLLVGLPALRLRADYFAIATIAMAEVVRIFAQNARGLTGGNQGIFCEEDDPSICYFERLAGRLGLDQRHRRELLERPRQPLPAAAGGLGDGDRGHLRADLRHQHPLGPGAASDPRGRGRGAGARQEHPALQAAVARDLGQPGRDRWLLPGAQPGDGPPDQDFEPLVTFFAFSVLILGGLANYKGVAVGAIIFWFVLEGTRFIDLPDPPFTETRIAALRLAITGLLLIGLMAFRPQGLFGKKEEMVLGE